MAESLDDALSPAGVADSAAQSGDQLKEMLACNDSRTRVKALGHILDGEQPIDGLVAAIEALQDSEAPSVFGMTEGDIASIVLAVRTSKPYTGNNVIAKHQIVLLTAQRSGNVGEPQCLRSHGGHGSAPITP